MKKILPISVLLAAALYSCSKSETTTPEPANCTTEKSYATDVAPIIASSCANGSGCHGTGSSNGPGPLLTYSQVFAARNAIRSSVASGSMPKGSALTSTDKNAILCWIDNGATNN